VRGRMRKRVRQAKKSEKIDKSPRLSTKRYLRAASKFAERNTAPCSADCICFESM
jgi:hypothetical protein